MHTYSIASEKYEDSEMIAIADTPSTDMPHWGHGDRGPHSFRLCSSTASLSSRSSNKSPRGKKLHWSKKSLTTLWVLTCRWHRLNLRQLEAEGGRGEGHGGR